MMVASTPDTVTPVVEQCEANGYPVVSTDCPWQTYLGQNKEYKWSYHVFFGAEDWITENWAVLRQDPEQQEVWAVCSTTPPTASSSAEQVPPFLRPRAIRLRPGPLPARHRGLHLTDRRFQEGGLSSSSSATDPARTSPTSGSRPAQQGLGAQEAAWSAKPSLFPQSVEALGDIANGLIKELWWHRTFPFDVLAHRRDLRSSWPTTSRQRPASSRLRPSSTTSSARWPSTLSRTPPTPRTRMPCWRPSRR